MKALARIIFISISILVFSSQLSAQSTKYKCLLQMSNYKGLEAYVVVSLIAPNGQYEKTLYVMGPDKQWHNGLKQWHKSLSKKNENLSAITGASIPAGDRSITTFNIDEAKMNKGYKLRFESSVEDQNYHEKDVEIPLTTEEITLKIEGTGYIRFVKLNKVQ